MSLSSSQRDQSSFATVIPVSTVSTTGDGSGPDHGVVAASATGDATDVPEAIERAMRALAHRAHSKGATAVVGARVVDITKWTMSATVVVMGTAITDPQA